ncbi:leucine-rich repeat-containing protein egg-6-like [Chironomus tepperi]|uniref:leucine-rich repeat-containing protein egg-6-like n=1 Tax=Chironomus tepperi TaxID=113505 RepID=UPI00391F9535
MKTLFGVFLTIFLCLNNSNAVNIECDVQDNVWTPFGYFKECLAYRVVSKEPGMQLHAIDSYYNLEDLHSFYIYQSPHCYYLPTNIADKFPNLKTLIAAHTGLLSITKEDLAPFPNILGLYIDYSKISSIQGDVFINNKNLQQLSLKENDIKYVEADSFKFLSKLTSLDFKNNPCYSGKADDRDDVGDLIINIEGNCNLRDYVKADVKDEIESSSHTHNKLSSEEEISEDD